MSTYQLLKLSSKYREHKESQELKSKTWNLKHGTNEPVRETEMDADTQNKPMLTKGERGWTTDKLGVWGQQI